jgi:hypothetical protein
VWKEGLREKAAQEEVSRKALFLAGLSIRRSFYTLLSGYDFETGSIRSYAEAAGCCVAVWHG